MDLGLHIINLIIAVIALIYAVKALSGNKKDKDFCKSMIICQISFTISILFRYPEIPWYDWILLASAAVIIVINGKRYLRYRDNEADE